MSPGHDADSSWATNAETSLSYLDGLLRYSGGLMYVRDAAEGRFVLVNPALEEEVGLPAEQIIGRRGHDIFPADAADEHRANDLLVLSDGVARTSREWAPSLDGTMREYISHKFALFDPHGVPYAIGGISTDITDLESERRTTLAAQHESEARFRAVFEHAPIGQIFSDMTGRVAEVNAPMASMLGYQPKEMCGRAISDLVDPVEMARIREATAAMMNAASSLTVSAIRRFTHRDGHRVPVRVTSALVRDASGGPRWWVSLVADITEEENARSELDRAHRATVCAAQRLQLLHSIAGAANESADIESAAAQILREVCHHFGWPAGVLLRWPTLSEPPGDPMVAHTWIDHSVDQALSAELLERAAVSRAAHVGLAEGQATPQLLRSCSKDEPAAIRKHEAIALPINGGSDLRYAWLFFDNPTAGRSDELNSDARELLALICLETARVVERQAAQRLLLNSEERFRSIFAGSPLPMALTIGDTGTFGAVNDSLCALLGRTEAELLGRGASDFAYPDDVRLLDPAGAAALAAPDNRYQFEMRLVHSSGALVITEITLTWMIGRDGTRLLLGQMENITARRKAEESLRRQADEDSLTGLANRTFLGRTLRDHAGRDSHVAVLFIDLDGFKLINDSRGHEVGDAVLVEVARRLEKAVRPSDVVARFGGDEFVVLCRGEIDESTALDIARRIEQSVSAPSLHAGTGAIRVTASVGIACGPINPQNPTELLQRADAAMYHAKRLGKDRSELYDARLHEHSLAYQRTEVALRNALDEDRFVLHYQPIVNLLERRIVGFEALVRLVDEAGELVSPQSFISVAEDTGLVVPMGTWVLRQACATIAHLRRQTGLRLTVSVNVAASQVARPDLCETVASALADACLDEDALCIELTESALLEAEESTLLQLNELRARGVQIALDDFGTGYSSLTYLRTFPVSHLKVDRSFVAGIDVIGGDRAIVRAVTGLARDLGLGCVAEGIETEAQLAELTAMGAPYGQGYLFSRPVPASELLRLVQRGVGIVLAIGA
jgi:diguanylate cyclase (GGDEF)-like protein/PAS domain S-box-containing protein